MMRGLRFPWVVIDEATQATEPRTLLALVRARVQRQIDGHTGAGGRGLGGQGRGAPLFDMRAWSAGYEALLRALVEARAGSARAMHVAVTAAGAWR